MSTEINKYRILCNTENTFVYSWGTTKPTHCPNDPAHTISDLIVIVETISSQNVTINENSDGYFETTHIVMNIPSGATGDVYVQDVTWPMDILLWKTLLTPSTDMLGDVINVLASPETAIGTLTATANIGDSTIVVDSTAIQNIQRGFLVTLDDGVNKNVCGRCTGIDTVNSTISFQTATSHSFSSGTPVKISVYVLKDIHIVDTNTINMGDKGIKGKTIPAGSILRIQYTNNTALSKTVYWRTEYYAGH